MRRPRPRLPHLLCLLALWMGAMVAHAAQTRSGLTIGEVLVAPVPGWILVSDTAARSILALNPSTLATERSFPLASDALPNLAPVRLALGADGTTLYVATSSPAGLAIIDLTTGDTRHLTLTENGATLPVNDVVESAPGRAWVLSRDARPPAEVDLDSGAVLRRLSGPADGSRMALDRARQRLFVAGYDRLTRYDLNGVEAPLSRITEARESLALSPDGLLLSSGGRLFSAETLSVVDRPVFNGGGAGDMGAFGRDDGRIYLPYYTGTPARAVGVMSLATLAPLGTIAEGCALDFYFGINLTEGPDGGSLVMWSDRGVCVLPKAVKPLDGPRNAPGDMVEDVLVDQARVFATVPTRNEVVIFRRDSLTPLRRLAVPGAPTRLVLAADGRRVFVTLAEGSGIAMIDLASLSVEFQRYAMGDYDTGFSDAALMADGRLLVNARRQARLGVIDDAPGHALHWLELPPEAHVVGMLFDPTRALAYFLRSTNDGEQIGQLNLADLEHVTLTSFGRLTNGQPIMQGLSVTRGIPVLILSANGERMASQDGLVFNPITRRLVHDFKRPLIMTFGSDNDTLYVARQEQPTLDRHALPSGLLRDSSQLKCIPQFSLHYAPPWEDIVGLSSNQLCTARAMTHFDTPPAKPREVIPSPALLQPLAVGTRLVFAQAGRRRTVETRPRPPDVGPRNAVQIEASGADPEYYVSSPSSYRLLGGREFHPEGTIRYLMQPPVELLRKGDAPRDRFSNTGTVALRDDEGQRAYVNYEFQRRLRGYQQVTVPAGSFRALRVDYVLRMFSSLVDFDERKVWTVWYVPGLGEVKERHRGEADYDLLKLPPVDPDRDGLPYARDNCPLLRTKNRGDLDRDGEGDACDADDDADGVGDWQDNCPRRANRDQQDLDLDSVGDACQGPG